MDITIRHTEPRDTIALQEIHGQPETVMGTLQVPFPSETAWKQRLEGIPAGSVSLVAEVDGKVVGHATVICPPNRPRRKHAGEIGMVVHRDYVRRGIGSALLGALVDLADNWLNLSRLELTVYADNEAAIGLYRKHGFETEGTHRRYAFRNGAYADCLAMARVRQ